MSRRRSQRAQTRIVKITIKIGELRTWDCKGSLTFSDKYPEANKPWWQSIMMCADRVKYCDHLHPPMV